MNHRLRCSFPRYGFAISPGVCANAIKPSLPGIAVRRTASLPLAYARQSIFFE
jgi:hypothetical protein